MYVNVTLEQSRWNHIPANLSTHGSYGAALQAQTEEGFRYEGAAVIVRVGAVHGNGRANLGVAAA